MVFTTISCVLRHRTIQCAGMIQDALRTKWKFVVEFEDEEIHEIWGTIGQADTREECEGLLEFDMQYHNSHGQIVLNAEAAEVCAKCEGEGQIAAMNGGVVICDACSGPGTPTFRPVRAFWPDLKFDDSSPEWDGILTDPTRRFLRSALAAAGCLTTEPGP
jgi:hypothetical protein